MKVVGLITEYNPFHLGHKYHIEKAKELAKADYCVVIMSGNHVQRGEPSFVDKYTKTNVALNNGADLIIELPYAFACASAEFFAYAAVTILDKLCCIDYICFGCECDNIEILSSISNILLKEPAKYKNILSNDLKCGFSFAAARGNALKACIDCQNIDEIISSPNNILAIEYIKALKKRNSNITPVPLKRIVAGYHDTSDSSKMYSASAIRCNNKIKESLVSIDSDYLNTYEKTYPVLPFDFSMHLLHSLNMHISKNTLSHIFGINLDLENKIKNNIDDFRNYEQFASLLKTKDISMTSVKRALLHSILDITDDDISIYLKNDICDFVRVLGFKKAASSILTEIKNNSNMHILTSLGSSKDILKNLPSHNQKLFDGWLASDNLYRLTANAKFDYSSNNEFSRKLIVK